MVASTAPPQAPRPPPWPTGLGEYLLLGMGNCLNTRNRRIHTRTELPTKVMGNFTAPACESMCSESSQCGGYIAYPQKEVCRLVMGNDRYYEGGISSSDGKVNIYCFRRADVPVVPHEPTGWELWGKMSLAIIAILIAGIGALMLFYFLVIAAGAA